MAEWKQEIIHTWYSCKNCPFKEPLYRPDGFGMRDELYAYNCGKGYFQQRKLNDMNCIPPYCEFSDKKKTGEERLCDLTDLDEQDLTNTLNSLSKDEQELISLFRQVKG